MNINYHLRATKIHYRHNLAAAFPLILICARTDIAKNYLSFAGATFQRLVEWRWHQSLQTAAIVQDGLAYGTTTLERSAY